MAFMRHNNNGGRRHHHNRHRNNQGGNQQQGGQRRHVNRVNQVFDSNGPDGRVRGTAAQIVEKFNSLARDAQASGDKVLMQNYFQHAEHYQRLLNEITEENATFEREREAQRAAQQAAEPAPGAADAPGPEAATDNASSLPGFVQVPIASGAPEPGAPLKTRQPRRVASAGGKSKDPASE